MHVFRKPSKLFIAILIVLVSLPVSWALADQFSASTSVSIGQSGKTYSGRVSSTSGRCVKGRSVTLLKRRRGQDDKFVGSDATNGNGVWSISGGRRGRYYVTVSARIRTRYGHRHSCGGASSRTV